jgi:nucleoid DNA-binding protein
MAMTMETTAKTHCKLTKAEMIERLAETQGMTKIDTSRVIDALFEVVRLV